MQTASKRTSPRREDIALSTAPKLEAGLKPQQLQKKNADLRQLAKECQQRQDTRMGQLKQMEAEHQKVFDELYKKALDQQKHLKQLQQKYANVPQSQKQVCQDPDRTYKRLIEWQNKSREKIQKLRDEKQQAEEARAKQVEAECTFRPQITKMAKSLSAEPHDVFDRLQRYSQMYSASRIQSKLDESKPDPRFTYVPNVSESSARADEYDRLRITMGSTWKRLTQSQSAKRPQHREVLVKEGFPSGAL